LAYSRVGTRGKPFEPTDCNSALGQARVNLSAAIEESSALVTNDELPTVMADEAQLVQLFQNLIGNAIKFRSEKPPYVHVSAQRIKDSEIPNPKSEIRNPKSESWVFSVRDNGIGIDRAYAKLGGECDTTSKMRYAFWTPEHFPERSISSDVVSQSKYTPS
jgi:light-regulated signal transduction histidine kinase (bacteriophytochrome)